MVILRTRNKITDFLMILAWASPFKNGGHCVRALRCHQGTTRGFRTKISIKLVYQFMAIFFIFSTTSSHLHPLQDEKCDSNSRLVVDENDNGKFKLERVKHDFNPFY